MKSQMNTRFVLHGTCESDPFSLSSRGLRGPPGPVEQGGR